MKKDDPGYCESSESVGVTVVTESADIKITATTEDDVEVDITIISGETRVEMRKCWDGEVWVDCS